MLTNVMNKLAVVSFVAYCCCTQCSSCQCWNQWADANCSDSGADSDCETLGSNIRM